MLRRMKSSVLSMCSFCRSYSARARSMPRVALDDVLVVAERVAHELAVLQLDDLAADRADEGAIVRDQHERPVYSARQASSRSMAAEIEVVGRLVEQQQVGLSHQHLGQLQAAALAARQRLDRARPVALARSRRRRRALDARLELVAAFALVALLQLAVAGEPSASPSAEARLERHHLVVQLLQRRRTARAARRAACRRRRAPATGAGRRRRPARARARRRFGLEVAGQQPQGRRLAGAVRPQQRQPVAGTDHEARRPTRISLPG